MAKLDADLCSPDFNHKGHEGTQRTLCSSRFISGCYRLMCGADTCGVHLPIRSGEPYRLQTLPYRQPIFLWRRRHDAVHPQVLRELPLMIGDVPDSGNSQARVGPGAWPSTRVRAFCALMVPACRLHNRRNRANISPVLAWFSPEPCRTARGFSIRKFTGVQP